MAVMAFDHGAAVYIWRHAAFKVHYPLRLIIEVGSPRVNRTCVHQGSGRETETEHSNG
jgi:hypothetical protein